MSLEIVGAEDLDDGTEIGDDDIEGMLGAYPQRRGGRGGGGGGMAMMRRPSQGFGRPQMQQRGASDSRELIVGFVYLQVAGGSSQVVTARPQVLFRPKRLLVPAAIASFFSIDDIKIGNRSQFVAAGPVPAEAFAPSAFGAALRMDTCQVSMEIILQVSNLSLAATDFRAAMFGDAVY
jgi:hypothetical protein